MPRTTTSTRKRPRVDEPAPARTSSHATPVPRTHDDDACASCGKTPPAVAFERFATSGKRHKTCTACRTARTLLALGAPRCAACDGAHRAHTCRNARGTRKAWWTPQEEANLQKLMGEMGTGRNWPAVAERLGTGRTPSAVEDHWRRHTGRRAQE